MWQGHRSEGQGGPESCTCRPPPQSAAYPLAWSASDPPEPAWNKTIKRRLVLKEQRLR